MQTWLAKLASVLPSPPWRLIGFTAGLTGLAAAGWVYRDTLLGLVRRI
jgi:hypothetical protein